MIRVLRTAVVVAVATGLASCVPVTDPTQVPGLVAVTAPPCSPDELTTVALGKTDAMGDRYVTFSTGGTGVWVSAKNFSHSGLFGSSPGSTWVYVGGQDRPPYYDTRIAQVANDTAGVMALEGYWSWLSLPPGDYWLEMGLDLDAVIASCEPNGITAPGSPG